MHTNWDFDVHPVVETLPFNAEDVGSSPVWGARVPHASWSKSQNVKQKQNCNKLNRDFKTWPIKINANKPKKKKRERERETGKEESCGLTLGK